MTVGDFNADGKPDLVSANYGSNTVSVLLGQGNGTFGPAQNFTVGAQPYSMAVGDFNADGKPDLATANVFSANVSVLLGQGDGTFGAPQNFTVGIGPVSVAVGDFNADGKADLATASFSNNNVSVLLGLGNGTFGAPQNFTVGDGPVSVVVGDINADGKPDLATVNLSSDNVSVLLGQGNGTFGAAQNYLVIGSFSVAVGDFNADGKTDLASANPISDNVSVLLSQTASFTRTPTVSGVPVCAGQAVTVAFSASGCGAGTLYNLQLSNASGSFANPTPLGSYPSGSSSVVIPASVPAGSGYRIRVISPSGGAPSNVSAAFRVRTCAVVNTRLAAEDGTGLLVVVSPNPTEGQLRIHLSGAAGQALKVELFNSAGRVLRQQGIEQAQVQEDLSWDISRQPPGLYLLRVRGEREAKTVKVLH